MNRSLSIVSLAIGITVSAGAVMAQEEGLRPHAAADNSDTIGVHVSGKITNVAEGELLEVELRLIDQGTFPERIQANPAGDFDFDNVGPGEYRLMIKDAHGRSVHEELISVTGRATFLTISLPESRVELPADGTVSIRQLQRNIPGPAKKEEHKFEQSLEKNDSAGAIAHLEKAIQIYPEYPDAHNNLGVCYSRLKRYDQALVEFQKAADLDPESARFTMNLSAALLRTGRFADAERAARRAIKLDPKDDKAAYMLGLSLLGQRSRYDEALENLSRVATRLHQARLALAEILTLQGKATRAADELRAYLVSVADAPNRQEVEAWLARLEK